MGGQHPGRSIVVGVDGSEQALQAVRWGAAEAERRHAPLRLVSAFAWVPDDSVGHSGLRERYREILLERTEIRLRGAVAVAERENPGVEIDHQVMVGSPYAVLGSEARRSQLVVVGDRGLTRVEGLLAGSVVVELAAHAACPVVVVRGTERDPSERAALPVVVGIGGSPTSEAAVAFAYDAAAVRQVPLVAVHTWWCPVVDPMTAPLLDWDAIETEERQLLADRLAGWAEKYPDVRVEYLVSCGPPARSLLEQTDGAQLVVVGSQGRGEFVGLVLGSVSNALVHRAACPVAVVRAAAGGGADAL
ncbi:MAG: UspA protein [Pseudonocardia sp.]|nr:UspA protein [Pseudonocardia sp.]